MSLDSRSLSSLFLKTFGVEYDSDANRNLFDVVVEHFVLNTNITDFHRKLEGLVSFKDLEISASQFRISLSESGQVILNMRYYAAYLAMYRGLDSMVAEDNYRRFDLCRCDAVRIFQSVKRLRTMITNKIKSKGHTVKDFSPAAFDAVRLGFDKHYKELSKHIRIKTSKKLRFIFQFNNMDRRDFHAELLICALRAYYKLHPCNRSDEYVLNYMRSTVNNRVVNIIEHYTTEKRQNLFSHGEGEDRSYRLNVVAESQLAVTYNSDGEEMPIENLYDDSVLTKTLNEFDYSVDRWLDKIGTRTRKGSILAIFVGRDVNEFTSWLRKKRLLRSKDKTCQDFISERSRSETLSLVAQYVDRDTNFVLQCLREAALDLGVSV